MGLAGYVCASAAGSRPTIMPTVSTRAIRRCLQINQAIRPSAKMHAAVLSWRYDKPQLLGRMVSHGFLRPQASLCGAMKDFWLSCGHHLLDRVRGGGLVVTD